MSAASGRIETGDVPALVRAVASLLLGIGILLVGNGLLGTLLGVRAVLERYPSSIIGIFMAAYFLGFILGSYLLPAVIERIGHIRGFAAMAAVASAAALAHGLMVHPLVWGALRLVTGICTMGFYMVIESWLHARTPNIYRGRVFAVYMVVTLAALAAGQYLILFDAATWVPFALASMLFSLGLVPVVLTGAREPEPIPGVRLGLGWLYTVSPVGVFGTLAAGLANSAFWGLGAVFARRLGFTDLGVAAFMSATILGGALLQWPIGRLSDYRDRRVVLLLVAFAAAGTAAIGYGLLGVAPLALLPAAFLYGGLAFTVYSVSVAHINDSLAPSQVLEATRGLLLVYSFGAVAGPVAVGPLMTAFGPRTLLLYFAAVFTLFGLFALYRLPKRAPVPSEEKGSFVPMTRTSQAALEMHPEVEVERRLGE